MRELKWTYAYDCTVEFYFPSGEPLYNLSLEDQIERAVIAECDHNRGSGVVLILNENSPEYQAIQRMRAEKEE